MRDNYWFDIGYQQHNGCFENGDMGTDVQIETLKHMQESFCVCAQPMRDDVTL